MNIFGLSAEIALPGKEMKGKRKIYMRLVLLSALMLSICIQSKADHYVIINNLNLVENSPVGSGNYRIDYTYTTDGLTVDRFQWELYVVEQGCNPTDGFNRAFFGCTTLNPVSDTYTGTLANNILLCSGKSYDAVLYVRRRGDCNATYNSTNGPNNPDPTGTGNICTTAGGCSAMTCGCPEDRSNVAVFQGLTKYPGLLDPVADATVWDGNPSDQYMDLYPVAGNPAGSPTQSDWDGNWGYIKDTLSGSGLPDFDISIDIDLEECLGSFDRSFSADETDGQVINENFGGATATVRCGSEARVVYNASNNCGANFPGNTFEIIDNSTNASFQLGSANITSVMGPGINVDGRFEDLDNAVAEGFICENGRISLSLRNASCSAEDHTQVNIDYNIEVVYPTSNFATPTKVNCSDVCGQDIILRSGDQWVTGTINSGGATTLPTTDDGAYSFDWNGQICQNTTNSDDCVNGSGGVRIDNCASCGIYDITYTIDNTICPTCSTETTKEVEIVGPKITSVTGAQIGCGPIVPNLSFQVMECDVNDPAGAATNSPYSGPGQKLWERSDNPGVYYAEGSASLNVAAGETVTFTPHFRNSTCTDCNAVGTPVTVQSLGDLVVTCPVSTDLGDFNCSNLSTIPAPPASLAAVQAAPYNITIGTDPCGTVSFTTMDDASPDACTSVTQTITRTIVITDSFDGRSATCTFTFDIIPFFQSPDITVPADQTIACNVFPTPTTLTYTNGQTNACLSTGSVTSTLTAHPGNCGGTITETWVIPSGANCSRGDITRTRTYTVMPTPAPTISCAPPQNLVGCDNSVVPAPDISTVTASTLCGNVTVIHVGDTQTGTACAANPLIVTRTYRATNECGATSTCTQTFTIVDNVLPVVSGVSDQLVNCTVDVQAAFTAWVASNGGGSVTENCSTVIWSTIPASPTLNTDYVSGPTEVTFVATDGCGQSAQMTANFRVRCVDIDKPAPANADNDGNGVVSLNDVLTYTISAINNGNVALSNVVVGDALIMPDEVTCATLAPGDTCKLIGMYTVMQPDVDATQIVNEAFAKPTNLDTVKDDNILPILRPGLNIAKQQPVLTTDTDGSGDFSEGDVITYTVIATNTGPTSLTNVVITDPMLTMPTTTCATVPSMGTCTLTGTYTILEGDVSDEEIMNTAMVVSDQTPDPASSSITTPLPTPMVMIQKATPTLKIDADMNLDISEGDSLEYIITVTNNGTANLSNVVIFDSKVNPSMISTDTLKMGEQLQLIGTYLVNDIDVAAGSIQNTATVSTNQTDDMSAMSMVSIPTYMLDLAKASPTLFSDADGSGDITEGDVLQYVITAQNVGSGRLTDITILDATLTPDELICPGITAPGATCTLTGTYTVQASDLGSDIVNEARATSVQTDTVAAQATIGVNEPSMAISKANPVLLPANDLDGSGDISVGDILTYTVTATNSGLVGMGSNLTNVTITDPLLLPMTETCAVLTPGQTCVLTGTYEVTAANLMAREIKNVASVVSDQLPMPVLDSTLTMLDTPMISLSKSSAMVFLDADMSGDFSAGDSIQYVVTAANNGSANLTNVVITDDKITPSTANCGLMMPGDICQLTGRYLITQADIDNGSVTNTATVVSDQAGDEMASSTTVLPIPSMTIDKQMPTIITDLNSDGLINTGDIISYDIVVTNTSPSANLTDIVVLDPTLTGLTGTGCTLVTPGMSCTYTGTYTATQSDIDAGMIFNKATATADQLLTPQSDSVTTLITPMPSIRLVKTAATPTDTNLDGLIGAGDSYDYTFVVTNTGNVTVTDIDIMDDLLGSTPGTIGSLTPGQDSTIIVSYTLTQPNVDLGQVVNTAEAIGTDPNMNPVMDTSDDGNELVDTPADPDTDPTNDPTVTTITQTPSLDIDKQQPTNIDVDGSGDISEGDTLVYTIVVTNDGNVTLMSVAISDPHITPSSISCGTLAPMDQCSLVGKYVVKRTDVENLGIMNTATGTSNLTMPVTDNADVSLLPTSMAVKKSTPVLTSDNDASGDISNGDVVTYTLTATNTGMANLTDVTISDPLLSPTSTLCPIVEPADSCVLTGTYTVVQVNIDNGFLRNTGNFDADQVDAQTAKDSFPLPTPEVMLTKSAPAAPISGDVDGSGDISAGDTLVYTITAEVPASSANITDLTITDPLITPSSATWALTLPGTQRMLVGKYVVTQSDVDNRLIDNMATATSDQAPTVTADNTQTLPNPVLSIQKLPGVLTMANDLDMSGDISRGDTLLYRIKTVNIGSANLTNVVVTDPLTTPTSTMCALVVPMDSCVLLGKYVVQASDLGNSVDNTASATSDQTDAIMASSSVNVPAPSYAINKPAPVLSDDRDFSSDISVNDILTYSIIVTNTGSVMDGGVLTDVVIRDTLLSPEEEICPTLLPGQTCVLTGTYQVTQEDVDAGGIMNNANAISDQVDSIFASQFQPIERPGLRLDKSTGVLTGDTDGSGDRSAGDTLTYTVTATNTGQTTLTNVMISDPKITPSNMMCTSLPRGGTCVLTGYYVITQDDVDRGTIGNRAAVVSNQTTGPVTDTTTVTLPTPAYTITKQDPIHTGDLNNNGVIDAGEELQYTIVVRNTGSAALTDVTITDPLITPNTITCDLVPSNGVCVLVGVYAVSQDSIDAGQIMNKATVTSDQLPADSTDNTFTITRDNEIRLVKMSSEPTDTNMDGLIGAEDSILYSFTVTNTGNSTVTNIMITDPLLGGLVGVIPSLSPGMTDASISKYYTLTQMNVDAGFVLNSALASGTSPEGPVTDISDDGNETVDSPNDPDSDPTNDPTETPIIRSPGISTVKSAPVLTDVDLNLQVSQGDTLRYTVTTYNTGNTTLMDVNVTDPLLTPAANSCAILLPKDSCVLEGYYVVLQSDVDNRSIVNIGSGESTTTPPVMDTETTPILTPSITINKPAPVRTTDIDMSGDNSVGDILTYTITATNNGGANLSNVVITDPLLSMTTMTCPLLLPTQSCVLIGTYTITDTDLANGMIMNTATVTSEQTEPMSDDQTQLLPNPSVIINKGVPTIVTDNDASGDFSSGDVIEYVITATNNGSAVLTNVVITDPLISPMSETCTSLAPNATCVLRGTYTITDTDVEVNKEIVNGAMVTTAQTDPVMDSLTTAMPQPAMSISKLSPVLTLDIDNNNSLSEGDILTYTIIVTNSGTSVLTNVEIMDDRIVPSSKVVASLAPGDTTTLVGTYVVQASDMGNTISNTATADADQVDPISDDTSVGIPFVDLEIDKSSPSMKTDVDGSGDFSVGDIVTYSVEVTNTADPMTGGGNLSNVVITDPSITPMTTTCALLLFNEKCILTGDYEITAADVAAGFVKNVATVTTAQAIPDKMDSTIQMLPQPSMEFVKSQPVLTADNDVSFDISDGDELTYRVVVYNTGTATLTDVTINDDLINPPIRICPSLAPQDSCVLVGTYIVTPGDVAAGRLKNKATATTRQTPMQVDSVEIDIPQPMLDVDKEVPVLFADQDGSGDPSVGDVLRYRIKAVNSGTANMSVVLITDELVTPASADCPLIMPGDSCILMGDHIITQEEVDAGMILNTGTVSSSQLPPIIDQEVIILPQPLSEVTKEVSSITDVDMSGNVSEGDIINYEVTLTNIGQANLTDGVISDPLLTPSTMDCPLLMPGQSCTMIGSYMLTLDDVNLGELSNTAAGITKQAIPPDSITLVTDIPEDPSMSITKIAAPVSDGSGDGVIGAEDTIFYQFFVTNTGNVSINVIGITDDIATGPVGNVGRLDPGQVDSSLTAFYIITIDDVDNGGVENQAIGSGTTDQGSTVTDDSDSGDETMDTDRDTDSDPTNDPTFVSIEPDPRVALTKQLSNVVYQENGDAALTFQITYQNTGNTIIGNVEVLDRFTFLPEADPIDQDIQVRVVNINAEVIDTSHIHNVVSKPSKVVTNKDGEDDHSHGPAAAGLTTGFNGQTNIEAFHDNSARLRPGQSFDVFLTVEVDPEVLIQIFERGDTVMNQAFGIGRPVKTDGTRFIDPTTNQPIPDPTDLSDDGVDPLTNNDRGDMEDPTIVVIPRIDIDKQLSGDIEPSSLEGFFDVRFVITVKNSGSSTIRGICMNDDFAANFGAEFGGIPEAVQIITSSATVDPDINLLFDGASITKFTDCESGVLAPGDSIVFLVTGSIMPGQDGQQNFVDVAGDGDLRNDNVAVVVAQDSIGFGECADDLACPAVINGTLDPQTCTFSLTSEMLGPQYDDILVAFQLYDEAGNYRGNMLTKEDAGKSFQYRVFDFCSGRFCWGTLNLELKEIPDEIVLDPIEIMCGDNRPREDLLTLDRVREVISNGCYPDLRDLRLTVDSTSVNPKCEIITVKRVVSAKFLVEDLVIEGDIMSQEIVISPIAPGMIRGPKGSGLSGFVQDSVLVLDCEDDIEPPFIAEKYGIASAYPYVLKDSILRDTILSRKVEVRDTVERQIEVDDLWVVFSVIEKRDSIVYDTMTLKTPQYIAITDPTICNWSVKKEDDFYPGCLGPESKIKRTWSLLEWCNGSSGELVQWINVTDTKGPDINEVIEYTVPITPWVCTAQLELPELIKKESCSNATVSWRSTAGVIDGNIISGMRLEDSPLTVIGTAQSDCGIEKSDTFTIYVIDASPPVMVAADKLNVSINTGQSNGTEGAENVGKVYVSSIDVGTHDSGCGEVTTCILRKEDYDAGAVILNDGSELVIAGNLAYRAQNTCYFDVYKEEIKDLKTGAVLSVIEHKYVTCDTYVKYCCEDIGIDHQIVLIAIDEAGLTATSWTDINVEDKPTIQCVNRRFIVSCDDDISVEKLGSIPVNSTSCNPLDITYEDSGAVDACGNGLITRTWMINGDISCVDEIVYETVPRFDPRQIKWPLPHTDEEVLARTRECVYDEDIEEHVIISSLLPVDTKPSMTCVVGEITGAPTWCDDRCMLIETSYEDVSVPTDVSCGKIIRRWTVIDWCTYSSNESSPQDDTNDSDDTYEVVDDTWLADTPCKDCEKRTAPDEPIYLRYTSVDLDGYYTYDQVIKIEDDTKPTITVVSADTVAIIDGATSKADNIDDCRAQKMILATAIDSCGGQSVDTRLSWWVDIIDANTRRTISQQSGQGSTMEVSTGYGVPGDEHIIQWNVTDGCGNTRSQRTRVVFEDRKNPTPVCIRNITTTTMSNTGEVTIWASDYDLGSYDNCGPVTTYFKDEEGNPTNSLTFTCDTWSSQNGQTSIEDIQLWAMDAAGNEDFCMATLRIQDNEDVCPDNGAASALIAGQIRTEDDDMIDESQVSLNKKSELMTGIDGAYVFSDVAMYEDYTISTLKEDNYLNGVTSLDLVMMQRHLLGLAPLNSPYKVIAADVNNDQRISSIDIIQLQKLLLGIYDKLPSNLSWRFVDAGQTFKNPMSPWPYTEEIIISNLDFDHMNEDFIGVKIGDLNASALPSSAKRVSKEKRDLITLVVNDLEVVAGDIVTITAEVNQAIDLGALQLTMEHAGLQLKSINGIKAEISEDNLGRLSKDLTTMVWSSAQGAKVQDEFFQLTFVATENVLLSEAIKVNSRVTEAIAYDGADNAYDVQLEFQEVLDDDGVFLLYQNTPNPFRDRTEIGFYTPQDGNVTLRILDVTGKVIFVNETYYPRGENVLSISKREMNAPSGVYYYEVELGDYVEKRKMIIVD